MKRKRQTCIKHFFHMPPVVGFVKKPWSLEIISETREPDQNLFIDKYFEIYGSQKISQSLFFNSAYTFSVAFKSGDLTNKNGRGDRAAFT